MSCQRKMSSLTRQSPDAGQVAVGAAFLSEVGWSWPGPSKHQSRRKMLMPRRPVKRSESLLQSLKRRQLSRSPYSKKRRRRQRRLRKACVWNFRSLGFAQSPTCIEWLRSSNMFILQWHVLPATPMATYLWCHTCGHSMLTGCDFQSAIG